MGPAISFEEGRAYFFVGCTIMSILKELAKENLLLIALQGCRAVLERELDINNVIFSMSSNVRQEHMRQAREKDALKFPYAFLTLNALAGVKELQNNFAIKKHGVRFDFAGLRATTAKGYLFPITLGLDFHYIDSDQTRLLTMSQSLVILSVLEGLTFQIDVGEIFSFKVRMEIPLETTINIMDGNAPDLPGASDMNVQMIMHTTIGFFRDVSVVNGLPPNMQIHVTGEESFNVPIPQMP